MPRVWELNLEVYIALYNGDAVGAWDLANSQWPTLQASQFLRVEYVAIVAFDFRARAAIAAAATNHLRQHCLVEALRCARKLARKHSRWAHAMAFLIRAGIASVRGERAATLRFLERAETEFRTADMSHYVAACEYRRGLLIGNEAGRALTSAAESWATAQGVVNAARIFQILPPENWAGF